MPSMMALPMQSLHGTSAEMAARRPPRSSSCHSKLGAQPVGAPGHEVINVLHALADSLI